MTGSFVKLPRVWWSMSPLVRVTLLLFFFFQAEDGIRDLTVTGVQTCALPIYRRALGGAGRLQRCVGVHGHPRIERLRVVDRVEDGFHGVHRRDLAPGNRGGEIGGGHEAQIVVGHEPSSAEGMLPRSRGGVRARGFARGGFRRRAGEADGGSRTPDRREDTASGNRRRRAARAASAACRASRGR